LSSLFSLVIFFGPIKLKEREDGPKETREREEIKGPQMPSLDFGGSKFLFFITCCSRMEPPNIPFPLPGALQSSSPE
jgi:hypothetical protein